MSHPTSTGCCGVLKHNPHKWPNGDVAIPDGTKCCCGTVTFDGTVTFAKHESSDAEDRAAEKRVHDKVRAVHAEAQKTERLRQVGGDHYAKYAIQPFDIIDCYGLNFYEASALKYLLRYRDKNGVEDLKKARHYIDVLIRKAEEQP